MLGMPNMNTNIWVLRDAYQSRVCSSTYCFASQWSWVGCNSEHSIRPGYHWTHNTLVPHYQQKYRPTTTQLGRSCLSVYICVCFILYVLCWSVNTLKCVIMHIFNVLYAFGCSCCVDSDNNGKRWAIYIFVYALCWYVNVFAHELNVLINAFWYSYCVDGCICVSLLFSPVVINAF